MMIDAYLIALDETDCYVIPTDDAPYIDKVRGIYLFDRNERVHCCEMTASHYLMYVYTSVLLTAAGESLPEEEQERISDWYKMGDDRYLHCRDVDALIAAGDDHHVYGATGVSYDDVDHDVQMDGLREHFSGNQPI